MQRVHLANRLLVGFFVATLCGCGGDGSSNPTVDVTGMWKGSISYLDRGPSPVTMELAQDGRDVRGTFDGEPASGFVEGDRVTVNVNHRDGDLLIVISMSGPVDGDSMNLSGLINGVYDNGAMVEMPAEGLFTRM